MDQENCNSVPGPSQSCFENKGRKRKSDLSYTSNKKYIYPESSENSNQVNQGNEETNEFSVNSNSEIHEKIREENSRYTENFAKEIEKKIFEKFEDIMQDYPDYKNWKVLAGIAISTAQSLEIISLATGTKCIYGKNLEQNGKVVQDCHAEIIARRGLKLFLLQNIDLYIDKNPFTIFTSKEGEISIKEKIHFHLYISSAPCGDGRIYSQNTLNKVDDPHPNKKNRGLLRTKIDGVKGTYPVKSNLKLTFNGLKSGSQKLRTACCSDKAAYWNVVGIQGALLSNFINPIYYKTITIGEYFNPSHLRRAMFGRIEKFVGGLPKPFLLNKPLLLGSEAPPLPTARNPTKYSLNWSSVTEGIEIIESSNGKTHNGEASRLSKYKIFELFLKIQDKISSHDGQKTAEEKEFMYSECKNKSKLYCLAQRICYDSFAAASLGIWVKKPKELNEFKLA